MAEIEVLGTRVFQHHRSHIPAIFQICGKPFLSLSLNLQRGALMKNIFKMDKEWSPQWAVYIILEA